MAANESNLAVDHDELAMVAFVKDADVANVMMVELHHLASRSFHLPLDRVADLLGADGVQQHAHLHTRACPLGKHIGNALTEHTFLPQKSLEVHRVLGCTDVFHEHIEKGAVLEHLDRVARDRRAKRQTGERRNQLVDRVITLDVQVGIPMALDRPDDERERYDEGGAQRQEEGCQHNDPHAARVAATICCDGSGASPSTAQRERP